MNDLRVTLPVWLRVRVRVRVTGSVTLRSLLGKVYIGRTVTIR